MALSLTPLMPLTAYAGLAPSLYIGDTDVTPTPGDSDTHYWTEENGQYAETGDPNDYQFSVAYISADESFTLTLNGIEIEGAYIEEMSSFFGIYTNSSLNLILADGSDNTVRAIYSGSDAVLPVGIFASDAVSIGGGGALDIAAESDAGAYGIYTEGDISVSGGTVTVSGESESDAFGLYSYSGSVSITGGTVTASATSASGIAYGITAGGPVTVRGGMIEAEAEAGRTACGIYSFGPNSHITIHSGTITASATSASENAYGLNAKDSIDVHGGIIEAEAKAGGTAYGIYSYGIIGISDGTVTASAEGENSRGIYAAENNIYIFDGTVTASADGENSCGIYAVENDIAIAGGIVTASADGAAFHAGGGMSVSAPSYKYRSNTVDAAPDSDYTLYPGTAYSNSSAYKYAEIIECPDVYAGGVKVSGITDRGNVSYWLDDGSGNITGADATAGNYDLKYNERSRTMTLNGVTITTPYRVAGDFGDFDTYCGIYSGGPLSLLLEDGSANSVKPVVADSLSHHVRSIYAEGSITVNGGGSVTAGADADAGEGIANGIYSGGSVVISGGMVTAAARNSSDVSGIHAYSRITILGGTVVASADDASGNSCGILAAAGILVSGGAVYASGNGGSVNRALYTYGTISPSASPAYGKYAVIMTERTDGGAYTPTLLYNSDEEPAVPDAGLWVGGFPFGAGGGGDWATADGGVYGDYFHDGDEETPDGVYTWSAKYDTNGTAGDSADDSYDLTLHGVNIANSHTINTTYTGIDIDYAIFSEPTLNLLLADGAENRVTVSSARTHYGIHAGNDLTIDGRGSITVTTGITDSSYGIHARGSLAVSGGAVTVAAGNMGVSADEDLSVSGGTVTAAALSAGLSSYGIYAGSDVNISGGTVHTTADASTLGYGIQAMFSLALSGGSTTAIGSYMALYYEEVNSSFTLPSTHKYKSNTSASNPGGDYTYGAYPYSAADKYVEIVAYTPSPANNGGGGGPSRTITVVETNSSLFSGSAGPIKAAANMSKAFSDSVEVKVTDTGEDASDFGLNVGSEIYPFDISLYIKGTNTKIQPNEGYAVTISLPVPESLLDRKEQLTVMHKSDDGTVMTLVSRLTQIGGVWYLVFAATEFSPYALVVGGAGVPYYLEANGSKVFIGFAANGKYIAPSGVTVLFMENDKSFTDVPGHWAAGYIGFVTEREIFLGTGADTFSPNTGMTRAMFATVVGRLYERSYGEIESAGFDAGAGAFTDCNYDAYYGKYVDWCAENGVIEGLGGGLFAPDREITRQEMAAILYRFADYLDVLPAGPDSGAALDYPDSGSIAAWAKNAAQYCQDTDIITGRTGGAFAPGETATRSEVAAIIQRFVESVVK
jgi:hypothetical protein